MVTTMPNKIMMPSLSEDGWVNTSSKIADYLFSHFLLSNYSQSQLFYGHVSSLPYILQQTQGNVPLAASKVEEALSNYFSRYFNSVVVECSEETNQENPSIGQITIYLKFTDSDNKEFILGKLLKVENMKVNEIISLNNG